MHIWILVAVLFLSRTAGAVRQCTGPPARVPGVAVQIPIHMPDKLQRNGTAGLVMPLSDANLRFYYFDMYSRELQRPATRLALKDALGLLVLVSQFYVAGVDAKREEMLASLQTNLLSPFVYRIYLLQETDADPRAITDSVAVPEGKLHFRTIGKRMEIRDGLDLANTEIHAEMQRIGRKLVVAISNLDDLFVSLTIVNVVDILAERWDKTLFYVSRTRAYEDAADKYVVESTRVNRHMCFDMLYGLSSDVFLLVPPLLYNQTKARLDVALGTNHIEGVLGQQILANVPGWGVSNLCSVWEVFHNHRYRARGTGNTLRPHIGNLPGYDGMGVPSNHFPPAREDNATFPCKNN